MSYFPEGSDVDYFSLLFQKPFVICNPKAQFNPSNQLGNSVVLGDNRPAFLLQFAYWVET